MRCFLCLTRFPVLYASSAEGDPAITANPIQLGYAPTSSPFQHRLAAHLRCVKFFDLLMSFSKVSWWKEFPACDERRGQGFKQMNGARVSVQGIISIHEENKHGALVCCFVKGQMNGIWAPGQLEGLELCTCCGAIFILLSFPLF